MGPVEIVWKNTTLAARFVRHYDGHSVRLGPPIDTLGCGRRGTAGIAKIGSGRKHAERIEWEHLETPGAT